jgi:hypothetical protein
MRRSSTITVPSANLLSVKFPSAGTITATTNLGIAWANPSNHAQLLGPLNGLDFVNGCTYLSVNLRNLDENDDFPTLSISLTIVDASGADLYAIGSTISQINAQIQTFNTLSFIIPPRSTPGAGIRGQVTVDNSLGGAVTVVVPAPVTFFGG